jgi:hypothetical protein
LQKYFVSRLDSSSPGAKIAIGGDIPLMYYNEITGKKIELDSPRLVIYTDNPCFALFNNVSMKYNTDNTNVYLTKWFAALKERIVSAADGNGEPEERIVINIGDDENAVNELEATKKTQEQEYARGTFFQLNDRIYFSYLHGPKYYRIFVGLVRLLDDSIITYDNIIYKQTLAVEVCSSMHIQYMNELVAEKKQSNPMINYFHDDEIARIRQWRNPTAYPRFKQYCDLTTDIINITVSPEHVNNIHLKGKYALFNEVVKLCCEKNISFDGKTIKRTSNTNVDALFTAIEQNLQPVIKTLYRASMPFEFDCNNIDPTQSTPKPSIFTLKSGDTFVYNGIMWASEPPAEKSIPDFYLGAGLYDCFIIQPPDNNKKAKFIVPYYRFRNAEKAINFDPYRVAYECIIPPGVKFQVKKVEFGLIKVCPLTWSGMSLVDDKKSAQTYWRRIITIEPQFTTRPAPVAGPTTTAPTGGKEKARKPRKNKLNEEFY